MSNHYEKYGKKWYEANKEKELARGTPLKISERLSNTSKVKPSCCATFALSGKECEFYCGEYPLCLGPEGYTGPRDITGHGGSCGV